MEITKAEARRFLIHYHGLGSSSTFNGEEGILNYMKRVGCIQYDPLNVVGMKLSVEKSLKMFCEYLQADGIHTESLNKIIK